MYDIYHWEAHPNSTYPEPDNLQERIPHYEAYLQKYPFITLPGLVDDGKGRQCIVSSKWRASYTTIVTVDLDGKIAYRKDFPNNFSNAYSGLDSKIGTLLDGIDSEPPVVEVTSPSSGDELQAGAVHNIEWTATDNVGVVSRAVYFSTGGVTWELIDSSDDNTGTYAWTVPDEASTNCRIKIYAYDAMGNAGEGESSTFTITGTGIITNLSEAGNRISFCKKPDAPIMYIPFTGAHTVTISNVQGKLLTSFAVSTRGGWYAMPELYSSGMHIVSIGTEQGTVIKKFLFTR